MSFKRVYSTAQGKPPEIARDTGARVDFPGRPDIDEVGVYEKAVNTWWYWSPYFTDESTAVTDSYGAIPGCFNWEVMTPYYQEDIQYMRTCNP